MNRISFFKSLFGQALVLIPLAGAKSKKSSPVLLLRRHIAGFQYGAGPGLLDLLNEGDELRLVPEPENKFDENAIAIYWKNHGIGYLPAVDNEIPGNILKQKARLSAKIEKLNKHGDPWEMCEVGLWIL